MNLDFTSNIFLEDDRVKLEPLGLEHFPALVPIALAHPDLLRYSPSPFGSAAGLTEYITGAIAERAQLRRYPFAIFDKINGTFAGSTSFGNVSNKDRRLEIGWTWLGKAYQLTGLNRHCKFKLLSYAFESLEFERVEFSIDSRNQPSQTAVEKIGGTFEGTFRSHTLMNDGYRRDTLRYSILKSEWPGIRSTVFKKFWQTLADGTLSQPDAKKASK